MSESSNVSDSTLTTQLAVVGAGPAGLAAATTAARAGLSVILVDTGRRPGGQYWRQRHARPDGDADPEGDHGGDHGGGGQHDRSTFRRLSRELSALRAGGRIRYLPDTAVWFLEPAGPGRPHVLRLAGGGVVAAEALVLCPGGYDRQLPIPGWDLPGVLAAGGVQALLKGHAVVPGRRAVVAGTGPFLLPVATGLAAAGAEVVAICEAGAPSSWLRRPAAVLSAPAKLIEGAGYAAALLRNRIPYRTRTVITRISGDDAVEAVSIARADRQGRPVAGTERELAADLVALGWGFTPSLELVLAAAAETRLDVDGSLVAEVDDGQRSSRTGVYVAGEATGVGGARLAVLEGELAALTAAEEAGLTPGPRTIRRANRLRRGIRRGRTFARAMHLAHPVPPGWPGWLDDDTTVCRCEEVTAGDIRHARDVLGAHDQRTLKMLARPGMGWCQGRVCGYAAACLAAGDRALEAADLRPLATRPLCAPVSLGELAELADEHGEPVP